MDLTRERLPQRTTGLGTGGSIHAGWMNGLGASAPTTGLVRARESQFLQSRLQALSEAVSTGRYRVSNLDLAEKLIHTMLEQ